MRNERNRLETLRYRPGTGFLTEFVVYARRLALLGLPRHEIARNLGATKETFNLWCRTYPEFAAALDEGTILGDIEIVEALRKRALGYTVKRKEVKGGNVVREWTEDVAPDVSAIQTWLFNRQPDIWRPVGKIEPQAPSAADLNARPVEFVPKEPEPAEEAQDAAPQPAA